MPQARICHRRCRRDGFIPWRLIARDNDALRTDIRNIRGDFTILSRYPRPGFVVRFADPDLGEREAVRCGLAARRVVREAPDRRQR